MSIHFGSVCLITLTAFCVACSGSDNKPRPSQVRADTTPPVITLLGDNPQIIEFGEPYIEQGATASDNRDGELTDAILIDASAVDTATLGQYVVMYNVSDAAGNPAASVTRTVICQDSTPPVITLLGDDPQAIIAGNPYVELGATVSDNFDGDITGAIVVDASTVDTLVSGSYSVMYNVVDSSGNRAVAATRTVRVLVTGGWRMTGSMFNERSGHGAVLLNDGRVLVVGGEWGIDQPHSGQAEIYDPVTEEFALAGEIAHATLTATLTVLLDGRVLIIRPAGVFGTGHSELYDPVTGTIRTIGPMQLPRWGYTATLLQDGRVLIAGGVSWQQDCEVFDSAELFDPATEEFTLTGSMSVARVEHTATRLNDGTVLMIGGRCCPCTYSGPPEHTLDSAEIYDPATGAFRETGSMPDTGVLRNAASLLPNGNVLVVVGREGWEVTEDWELVSNVVYDVASGLFKLTAQMQTISSGSHIAVALRSGAECAGPIMVVASGPLGNWNSVELYEPELERFYSTAALPEARGGGQSVTLLQDGRILVTGGHQKRPNEPDVPSTAFSSAMIFEPIGECM